MGFRPETEVLVSIQFSEEIVSSDVTHVWVGHQNGGTLEFGSFPALVAVPLVATRLALSVKFIIWGAYT